MRKRFSFHVTVAVLFAITSILCFSLSKNDFFSSNTFIIDYTEKKSFNIQRENLIVTSLDSITYIAHDSIYIANDADFHTQAPLEGWDAYGGTGDYTKPYIIENYNISSSITHLIWIQNCTTVFFEIRNCYLDGYSDGYNGLHFYNVSHANVTGNYITNCNTGIYITENSGMHGGNMLEENEISNTISNGVVIRSSSNNNYLVQNSIYNSGEDGILLESVFINTLSGNDISLSGQNGVHLITSNYTDISSNTISECTENGIFVDNTATNNTLNWNQIQFCNFNGIKLQQSSSENNITMNTIQNCDRNGITLLSDANFNNISFNNVYNVSYSGIYLSNDCYNEISENTIYRTYQQQDTWIYGIKLNCSKSNKVLRNNIYSYDSAVDHYGLAVYDSQDISIFNNSIISCTWGIYLISTNNTDVAYNNVSRNDHMGIFTNKTTNVDFIENYIYQNEDGFYFIDNNYTLIVDNIIMQNQRYGVYLDSKTTETFVFANDIIDNLYQALDDGSINFFCSTEEIFDPSEPYYHIGNHWSDWTCPDENVDGIVDYPYSISGSAGSLDNYPLVSPRFKLVEHTLSPPIVIYPNGGETLTHEYNVVWIPAQDSWHHCISYSLYYSPNSGATWMFIATVGLSSNSPQTSYNWQIPYSIQEGATYLIKVVAHCKGGNYDDLSAEDISNAPFSITYGTTTTTTSTTDDGGIIPYPSWIIILFSVIIFMVIQRKKKKA